MIILGVETSCREGGIALLDDERLIAERSLPSEGRRHAQSLVKEVAEVLHAHKLSPGDVEVVAVSIGPGSFTGLRVGVTFAKTWCYATECRLVAVDTLQAVAEQTPPDADRVFAVADAQRGDLYVGEYHLRGGPHPGEGQSPMTRMGPLAIVEAGEFAGRLSSGDFLTGPGLARYASRFAGRCRVAAAEDRLPRAASVACIGRRSAAAGRFADFWTLEPSYVRRSAAEEKLGR